MKKMLFNPTWKMSSRIGGCNFYVVYQQDLEIGMGDFSLLGKKCFKFFIGCLLKYSLRN